MQMVVEKEVEGAAAEKHPGNKASKEGEEERKSSHQDGYDEAIQD